MKWQEQKYTAEILKLIETMKEEKEYHNTQMKEIKDNREFYKTSLEKNGNNKKQDNQLIETMQQGLLVQEKGCTAL